MIILFLYQHFKGRVHQTRRQGEVNSSLTFLTDPEDDHLRPLLVISVGVLFLFFSTYGSAHRMIICGHSSTSKFNVVWPAIFLSCHFPGSFVFVFFLALMGGLMTAFCEMYSEVNKRTEKISHFPVPVRSFSKLAPDGKSWRQETSPLKKKIYSVININ